MKNASMTLNFYEIEKDEKSKVCDDITRRSFQVSDFLAEPSVTKLIEIDKIIVDKPYRNSGYGSEILTNFCKDKDDTIIIVGAGAMSSEYKEEPSVEEYRSLFNKLDKFYTKNNFEDVTELFGTYDGSTKKTFLCLNEAGKTAIEDRKEYIKKD